MKSLFTLLLLAAGLFAKSTPAKPAFNEAVKTFEATYGKHADASWICTPQGCQVEFEHKGQFITALYSPAGQLRWYKKHIASTELPVMLQMRLKNRLASYWISDVVEQSGNEGTAYLLTLENGGQKTVLKAVGGRWQTLQSRAK